MASVTASYRVAAARIDAREGTARLAWWIGAALVVVNSFWIIWANRFLPLSDYGDYTFEGWIFSRILHGASFPQYHIREYAFTHAAVPLLCGFLNFVFSPEVSAKIVLSLAIVMFIAGSRYLVASLGGNESSLLFFVPLLYVFNSAFFFGEIDWYLGFTGFLFFAGYLIRRRERPETIASSILFASLCAIFITHLMAYVACLTVVAGLFFERRTRMMLKRVVMPALVSTLLPIWYVVGRIATHQLGNLPAFEPWTRRALISNYIDTFSLFHIFLPWVDGHSTAMHIAGAANFCAAIGVGALLVGCLGALLKGDRNDWALLAAVAICLFGYVAGGQRIFGATGAERLPFPAVWLAMTWMAPRWKPTDVFLKSLQVSAVAVLALQACVFNLEIAKASNGLAGLYSTFAQERSRSEFCATYEDFYNRTWAQPHRPAFEKLIPNHQNTIRLPYYLYIERGETPPIFDVGLFVYTGPGNRDNLCQADW